MGNDAPKPTPAGQAPTRAPAAITLPRATLSIHACPYGHSIPHLRIPAKPSKIDYSIDLIATVLSDDGSTAVVRWFASDDPNRCETVEIGGVTVQALVTHIEGALQGIITRIPCRDNPYNPDWRMVSLFINENGGDANNYLRAEGYLFCFQQPTLFTVARIFNMDWDAYGGGPLAGDVNQDGIVDDADLLAVLFAFGQTGSGLPEDINGDGVVDDADLLTVLFNFGSTC
jgi:hypothetical protein